MNPIRFGQAYYPLFLSYEGAEKAAQNLADRFQKAGQNAALVKIPGSPYPPTVVTGDEFTRFEILTRDHQQGLDEASYRSRLADIIRSPMVLQVRGNNMFESSPNPPKELSDLLGPDLVS